MGSYFDDFDDRYGNMKDTALICENGHLVNDSMKKYPEYNTKFCKECGAKTVSKCPKCSSEIEGKIHYDGIVDCDSIEIPSYCHNCGSPYPWTESKLQALKETVDLMEELSIEEKKEFINSAKDIITDNPRTNLSALKLKKVGAKVGTEIWNVAKEILVQIGTETALKTAGLK